MKRWKKGSFTVEASLLMAIILPVLIAVVLAGFYLHDSAFLESTATELCSMGSNLRWYDGQLSELEKARNKRLTHSMLWTGNASGTVSAGQETVSAQLSGTFVLPGLVGRLMNGSHLTISKKWNCRLYQPTELIWKMRAAKYLADAALF